MGWMVSYEPDFKVVHLDFSGPHKAQEIFDASFAAIELAKKHNSFLFYVNAIKLIIIARRSELFELPDKLYRLWELDPESKIAIVEPKDPGANSKARFHVMASKNLGWFAEIFDTGQKAMLWLME